MFFLDKISVAGVRHTADGFLVADARVARTGIQEYLGSELGRPDLKTVKLYRPEGEVFAADAMRSYAYRPITIDHPSGLVDASTWKKVAAGQTGGEVVRDGEFVRVPLALMDAAAIKAYEDGKRQLSMGYTADIKFGDGVTPDGQHYDAIQTNLRMNHLALVDQARGGSELRIGDGHAPDGNRTDSAVNPQGTTTMSNANTRTVMVDGLPVECTDASAIAIDKLQRQLQDTVAATKASLDLKDAALAKLEAERDALKAKAMTDAQLDERVQARSDLVTKAKAIHDTDYRGKSDTEVRKIAVVGKLGAQIVDGKSDAYVEARFDILANDAKADPVAAALRSGSSTQVADNGYAASVANVDFRNRNQQGG